MSGKQNDYSAAPAADVEKLSAGDPENESRIESTPNGMGAISSGHGSVETAMNGRYSEIETSELIVEEPRAISAPAAKVTIGSPEFDGLSTGALKDGLVREPTLDDELTNTEKTELQSCEQEIDENLRSYFFSVGEALTTIKEKLLYRATHRSFEGYCKERFGIGRAYSSRLRNAYAVAKNLSRTGTMPRNEWQMRPLLKLETTDEQIKAWSLALTMAQGQQPTAKQVSDSAECSRYRGKAARSAQESWWPELLHFGTGPIPKESVEASLQNLVGFSDPGNPEQRDRLRWSQHFLVQLASTANRQLKKCKRQEKVDFMRDAARELTNLMEEVRTRQTLRGQLSPPLPNESHFEEFFEVPEYFSEM